MTQPGSRIVNIDGVSKTYQTPTASIHALHDVTLEVDNGEFVAIVGASGCGKTTLLNIVAGLTTASDGTVMRSPLIHRPGGIGMVFQTPTLLPWRSVRRNVLLTAELLRMPRSESERRANALLDLVGLSGFEDAMPHQLSGGMQQRVSLCRALISDPPLLLMDEPFGALDAMTRETMTMELQRILMEDRVSVLFVTHSITEAIFLADRIVVLTPRPGSIAGTLENELPRPRTIRAFETPEFAAYSLRVRELIGRDGPE